MQTETGIRIPTTPKTRSSPPPVTCAPRGPPGDWYKAIFAYNHADCYVQRIFSDFRRFYGGAMSSGAGAPSSAGGCGPSVGTNAILQHAERLYRPRSFKPLPSRFWVGGGEPESVDARIWPDAVWLMQTYHLPASAAREGGHMTHGDGTALDLVPASGLGWDGTARRAAEDLGWRESCGASGTAPVCPLVPAIQFIGYNGYPGHGDPSHTRAAMPICTSPGKAQTSVAVPGRFAGPMNG
jgi:hypothetical protein